MDYAIIPSLPEDRETVVIPLGDVPISPPVVGIARDSVVAYPFLPGEMDSSVMLYND